MAEEQCEGDQPLPGFIKWKRDGHDVSEQKEYYFLVHHAIIR